MFFALYLLEWQHFFSVFCLFVFVAVKPAVYAAAVILACLPMMRAAKVTTVLWFSSSVTGEFLLIYKYKEGSKFEDRQRGKYRRKASGWEVLEVKKMIWEG